MKVKVEGQGHLVTREPDLDILSFDIHTKMSVLLALRVRWTDTQRHNVKTITPVTSEMWGVIITH